MSAAGLAKTTAIPEIYLCDGDLPAAVDSIEALFVEHDRQILQRGGVLFVALPGGPVRATAALLRIRAMRLARFYKIGPEPDYNARCIDPPLQLFGALLHKGEWGFPQFNDDPCGSPE